MVTIKATPTDIQNAFVKWRLASKGVPETEEFSKLLPEEKAVLDTKTFLEYLCEVVR